MNAKEYVYVAIFYHEYGTDARVFRDLKDAKAWCDEIAYNYWDSAFPSEERPITDIGDEYFNRMDEGCCAYNESFRIVKTVIE